MLIVVVVVFFRLILGLLLEPRELGAQVGDEALVAAPRAERHVGLEEGRLHRPAVARGAGVPGEVWDAEPAGRRLHDALDRVGLGHDARVRPHVALMQAGHDLHRAVQERGLLRQELVEDRGQHQVGLAQRRAHGGGELRDRHGRYLRGARAGEARNDLLEPPGDHVPVQLRAALCEVHDPQACAHDGEDADPGPPVQARLLHEVEQAARRLARLPGAPRVRAGLGRAPLGDELELHGDADGPHVHARAALLRVGVDRADDHRGQPHGAADAVAPGARGEEPGRRPGEALQRRLGKVGLQ